MTFEQEFKEKVKEVADEEFGDEPLIKTYILTGELVKFAKRFYQMGQEG
jgi:hypothetical protein